MPFRTAAVVTLVFLHVLVDTDPAEAQGQSGKLGGGAGFAFLSDPDVDLGSTATVGGFIGYRFNDNVSLEGGLFFVRVNRVFSADGIPVDQTPDTPAFRFETTRFQADGVVMINLGRRQPFHPFVLFGGGVQRRDDKQTDLTFTINPDTGLQVLDSTEVVLDETTYVPTAILGGGAEIYFKYNLAARAEFRLWVPEAIEERTFALFFAATYFF